MFHAQCRVSKRYLGFDLWMLTIHPRFARCLSFADATHPLKTETRSISQDVISAADVDVAAVYRAGAISGIPVPPYSRTLRAVSPVVLTAAAIVACTGLDQIV
jgi:hypothetical protein